ncbi:hypothetical protein AAG906_007988 [Vitis piasezkii]
MRSMSYLPGMGLGRRQHGPSEFMAFPDHNVPFGLRFIPTEADYHYMARLCKERVRARLTHTPFYYPVRSYTISLADYFIALLELASPFDLFGVSILEIAEEIQVAPAPEVAEDVIVVDASDFVDPPLSFDVLSGFVSRHDYHDSDDDSSSVSDSDPVDERVSPAVGNTEIVDFDTQCLLIIFVASFNVLTALWIVKTSQAKEKTKEKQSEEKSKCSSCSLLSHFWSTSEVQFLHAIYHFKALEVKNPTIQTDERLNFRFLGVKEARITLNDQYMVSSNFCMPYWIRDQEGRLVRIENPQDTELDICVNIMDPPPEDQNSQQGQGGNPNQLVIRPHIVPLLPNFHGMESENPYAHIKEFEKVTNGLKRQISNFSAKENEKFHECWERYMEAINACPHHGFDTWLLVSYFYDGMSSSMKQILETMCGGDFMSKNPEEAMDFLSYVSEVSRGWDEPNSREKGKFPSQPTQNPKGGMYVLSEDMDMKAKVATIARRLEELELKKMHEVQAISRPKPMPCHAPFANHVIMW